MPGGPPVVEFGNVLDEGSVRMVADVVDEVRERKGQWSERLRAAVGLDRRPDPLLDELDDRAVGVPGPKTSVTPICFSRSASSSGIVPPTRKTTSSSSLSRSIWQSSSAYSMCAPERLDSPSTAASSWMTARRIESGVWKMPV